jgi:rubrerythrin
MAETQLQESGNSRFAEDNAEPVVEAVVFPSLEPRKREYFQFFLFRSLELKSCYENIARMIRGTTQKKLLMNMVERKRVAERKLRAILGETNANSNLRERQVLSPFTQYMLSTDMRPVNSINEVFIFISKSEQKDLELYSRLADLEENPEIKNIFLEQTRVCRQHISSLEDDFAHMTLGGDLES